jgi:hypothetical protein
MHTEGHDMGKDAVGNTKPAAQMPKFDDEHPGYETTDVHVGGVVVFLGGLMGFLVIFFLVCYYLGIGINNIWEKEDGATTKWKIAEGAPVRGKGKDLASTTEMQQQELQRMTANFPSPRLDIDDGEQSTADLHAKEDLLLEHYSSVDGQPGVVRIPIERAMELIAERGLPVAKQATAATESMAGVSRPEIHAPLTTGFARTGFELTVIEAREQKMNYGKAEAAAVAEPAPTK